MINDIMKGRWYGRYLHRLHQPMIKVYVDEPVDVGL